MSPYAEITYVESEVITDIETIDPKVATTLWDFTAFVFLRN